MSVREWAIVMLASVTCLAGGPTATGGEDEARAIFQGKWEVRVYPLEMANPRMIADSLTDMGLPARISASMVTRSVIVNAPPKVHATIERLVSTLDVPAAGQIPATAFIKLKHRDPEEVAELVHKIIPLRAARVAFDRASQLVIMKGEEPAVAMARELVNKIDRPQRSLTLRFVFVQGKVGVGSDEPSPGLPKALRPVARALAASGFMDMSLLAPFTTAVQESAQFETSGFLRTADNESLEFRIHGEVHPATGEETARFTIEAEISGRSPGEDFHTLFMVETTLTVKLGDKVVLAAAPSKTGDNEAIALIVEAGRN